MKKILFLMLMLTNMIHAQNYKDQWRKVEDFELKDLPKSALAEVENIYQKAQRERNSEQIIKTLFYKSKFMLILEENAQLIVINQFKKHTSESTFPEKNMLENVLANLYWQYFSQHRWQFYNRTKTTQKVDKTDFRTWDSQTLFEEVHFYFDKSLQSEEKLKKIAIEQFSEILKFEDKTKEIQPTLYDFLAQNALNFYKTNETHLTKPAYQFKIDNPEFIADATVFSNLNINTKDKFSLQFNALKIYQKLIKFHKKKKNLKAFAKIDLERLDFVNKHKTFHNGEKLYVNTLTSTEKKYQHHEISGWYAYKIAEIYNNNANSKKEYYKNDNRKALEICKKVITKFPDSQGAIQCKALKENIENQSIRIRVEEFIPVNKPSRALVTYRNTDKVYFSAYQFNDEVFKSLRNLNSEDKIKAISKLKLVKKWESKLRNEHDYIEHSTEIIIPKLNNGHYIIVASTSEKMNGKSIFGFTQTQATNLVFIKDSPNKFQVVNRVSGVPIANAKVQLKNENRGYSSKINKTLTSDKNGFITIKTNERHHSVIATISTKNDSAIFGEYYIFEREKHKEYKDKFVVNPFIFTDRSIYRPNQTVYFKGILVARENFKSSVFSEENVTVSLIDFNHKKIKSLELKTNEFGSVSGEFILPNNGLTGQYQIRIEGNRRFFNGNHYFSVEEYKRPKFEVDFKPVTGTYKVNDEISINGFAKAFSGVNITDAKVTYRVFRTARYPRWCYWYPRAMSAPQEIKNGEISTDEKGNFNFKFKALVDESVNKENLPIFTYTVTAEVTDINGETHKATTLVNVGYQALVATISVPNKMDKNEKNHTLKIDTKNLNNEFVPAKGTLKIYKLQAPKSPLRHRPWNLPDYQDISEDEFRKLFPFDAYSEDEFNSKKWKKGALVFDENFDTSKEKEIKLSRIKKWESGKYIATLTSEDKFNQKVKDEARFLIFSKKETETPDNAMFFIQQEKENYQTGENVKLQIGTALKDITLMLSVEKNHEISETKIIKLNDEVQTISLPFTKKDADLGGFAVHYYFVANNSFESGDFLFETKKVYPKLEIETKTFRDKLQPGSEQTWNFTIKNDKNNKATSEVLASMYDMSLDAFRLNNWHFNPFRFRHYRRFSSSSAYQCFNTTDFRFFNEKSLNLRNLSFSEVHWNWFGFNLDDKYKNKEYLSGLKLKHKIEKFKLDEKLLDGYYVRGTVYSEYLSVFPGVTVKVVGTTKKTITDADGFFFIKVKKGDLLKFSFKGMKHQTIKPKKELDIILTSTEINDHVISASRTITGYGGGKKAKALQAKAVKMNDSANIEYAALPDTESEEEVVEEVAVENIGETEIDNELSKVQARENLQETAFFYPKLTTDKKGNVSFSFTMPEALTRWKLQLLAHNKQLYSAVKTLETVTQKELMVVPNAPRFLRQGDEITLSAKISNLSKKNLQGTAQLILTNAITGKTVDLLENSKKNQSFSVDSDGNTNVSWNLKIPDTIDAVQYKIVAKAGDFSDGEQNALPVLSNRMLVTETLPIWVNSNQIKTFTLEKLKTQKSSSLKHHKLTLEVTSNPAWYAVQALPYLMEYPYECAEQTFSRYYANTLAGHIVQQNPRIKQVFEQWKTSETLISNLEKNQELKSLIIEQTPWLRDAESETEQKKRIALLFDLNKMKSMQQKALNKLEGMQFSDGGFSWFKGAHKPNPYISQHIATGFGHLQQLGVNTSDSQKMTRKLVSYLDDYIVKRYQELLRRSKKAKNPTAFLANKNTYDFELQYLYMRSFYPQKLSKKTEKARLYYANQSAKHWQDFSLYGKGMVALVQFRNGNKTLANAILKSLEENSITSEELGMYWKSNVSGWRWYQAPIETQSLLIEAFSEIKNDTKTINNLKKWLLKNKQVSRWKTTKATADAVYALLLQGTDWISVTDLIDVQLGGLEVNPTKIPEVQLEAGTGYFKTSWSADEIKPKMAEVSIISKGKVSSWGGLYWQYFEDLDKITSAETPLKLKKKLFKKVNSDTGKELIEINQTSDLKVGDLLTVRIELRSDRDMEFIFMKDMRASGVEPISVLSKYKWQDGLGYYESTKDASTNFFFERLPKGVYVFEYDVRVNNAGNFSNGITTIESMYAPEFKSHSEGVRIQVKK